MAVLAIAAVGAVVGSTVGYTALGWAVGSLVGSMLFPPKQPNNYQAQQLIDLKVTGTDYGQNIPWARGTVVAAGQFWWNSDRQPVYTTTQSGGGGGGKGGGGGGGYTYSTTITYKLDCLIGLLDNTAHGIRRIWLNGALVYNVGADADIDTLTNSINAPHWERMTFYGGADDQLPDPDYEAAVGSGNAPAYIGRSCVFIKGLQLGSAGAIPNLTFEIVCEGSSAQFGLQTSGTPFYTFPTGYEGISWLQINAQEIFMTNGSAATPGTAMAVLSVFDASGLGIQAYPSANRRVPIGLDIKSALWQYETNASPGWTGRFFRVLPSGRVDYVEPTVYYASGALLEGDLSEQLWITSSTYGHIVRLSGFHWGDRDRGHDCDSEEFSRPAGWNNCRLASNAGIYGSYVAIDNNTNTQTFRVGKVHIDSGAATTIYTSANTVRCRPSVDRSGYIWFMDDTGAGSVARLKKIDLTGNTIATIDLPGTSAPDTSTNFRVCAAIHGVTYVQAVSAGIFKFFAVDQTTHAILYTSGTLATSYTLVEAPNAPTGFVYKANAGADELYVINALPEDVAGGLITAAPPTIAEVQADICERCGLSSSEYDVSALSTITRAVRGFVWPDAASGRVASESLMGAFFYEATVSDKIYFRPRGRAVAATLTYDDLGAVDGDGDSAEPLALKKSNDLEIPAQIAVKYFNVNDDYQRDTQLDDRLVTTMAGSIESVELPIALTPTEGKQVAAVRAQDWAAAQLSATIGTLGTQCALEPTDAVTLTLKDGATQRMRIVKRTDDFPRLEFDVVSDDASIYAPTGTTDAVENDSTAVFKLPVSLMLLLDIPLLRDEDDGAGLYVAARGLFTPFPGCAFYKSLDDVEFAQQALMAESATFGWATTKLADWTGPRIFDEANTVTIAIPNGTAASSTRAAVLNDASVNAFLVGDEIIQAVTVTLVSEGVYTLSSLLRGCRGTEWATGTHLEGEIVVALLETGMRRITLLNNELGQAQYWKAATLGTAVASAVSEAFTPTGISQKPNSPIDFRVTRDTSNNCTLTWQRRSRLRCRMIGTLGISVPLGEETERYEVDIYSSSGYSTVLRTISVSGTPTASYTAAQQTTDGLTPGATLYAKVYQLSDLVGRGYALTTSA